MTDKGEIRAKKVVILRRHVVARSCRHGRGGSAASCSGTLLHRHRAGREPAAQSAGAVPWRRVDLLQGRCRQSSSWASSNRNAKRGGRRAFPKASPSTRFRKMSNHIAPYLEQATRRVPVLQKTGVQLFFNGPESFTPMTLSPRRDAGGARLFCATGFNSIGILSSGGGVARHWPTGSATGIRQWS